MTMYILKVTECKIGNRYMEHCIKNNTFFFGYFKKDALFRKIYTKTQGFRGATRMCYVYGNIRYEKVLVETENDFSGEKT